jgi:hypothetical protein
VNSSVRWRQDRTETILKESKYARNHVLAVFVPILLYQIYIVFTAYKTSTALERLLLGLGAELPAITRSFLSSYKLFALIPAISLFVAIDIYRRTERTVLYFSIAIFVSLLAAFLMQAWINEAWFTPIFTLLEKIG